MPSVYYIAEHNSLIWMYSFYYVNGGRGTVLFLLWVSSIYYLLTSLICFCLRGEISVKVQVYKEKGKSALKAFFPIPYNTVAKTASHSSY